LLSNRSINLALSVRGLNALKKPGLGLHEQVLGLVIPMKGRMLHVDKGRLVSHPYGVFGEVSLQHFARFVLANIDLHSLTFVITANSVLIRLIELNYLNCF